MELTRATTPGRDKCLRGHHSNSSYAPSENWTSFKNDVTGDLWVGQVLREQAVACFPPADSSDRSCS